MSTGPRAPRPSGPGRRPLAAAADVAVAVVTTAFAVLPMVPVFGWRAILPPVAGGVLLGTGLAVVAARRRWTVLGTTAVVIVAYLLLGGVLAAPTTTVLGGLPTLETVTGLLTGVVTVWKEVLTLDPSLGSVGHVLVAPYLLTLVASTLMVGLALRLRGPRAAWAALVPPAALVVSVLLGTKSTVLPVTAGTVVAVALLVWVAWRRGSLARRRFVALGLVALAVVGGAVVGGPVVGQDRDRLVVRDELVPPFDPRDHPSPLAAFRKFVKEWEETELLTVRGLPEGAPVRLATLDAFDGVVWNVAGAEAAEGSGRFRRVGETILTSVRGEPVDVEIEVHDLPMVWLPTVGYAEQVRFLGPQRLELAGDLRYNDATGAAVLRGGVPAGARYELRAVLPPTPDDDEIGQVQPAAVALPDAERVPEAVGLFASDIAGTATSPVLIARSLEQGLQERGWFSHGQVEAGDEPSLSGHGADRITTLLTADLMVGDGEQYASAMALMAREMGMPSRVVLGFVQDEDTVDTDDDDGVTFTGADVEAWVEIAFAGHGWLRFDPTPPESKTPSDETPDERSEPQPQVMQPPPPPQDPVQPPDDDTERARTDDTNEEIDGGWAWGPVLIQIAVVTVPVLLVVTPFLLVLAAKSRRRFRRRSTGDAVGRVVGGWEELVDEARDLRRPVPPTATRREAAVHLARSFAAAGRRGQEDPEARSRRAARVGGPVAGLAAGADAFVFGPGEPRPEQVEAYWEQVERAVTTMRSVVPVRQRLRARFSPASLRDRRRERRAEARAEQVAARAARRRHRRSGGPRDGGGRRSRPRGTGSVSTP